MSLKALATALTLAAITPFQGVAWAETRVCVLNFERAYHPFTRLIDETFRKKPDIQVFSEAVPRNLLDCIQAGSREIIVVAHSVPIESGHALGYFKRLPQAERDIRLAQTKASLEEQILNTSSGDKRDELKTQLSQVEAFPPYYPLYDRFMILPNIFDKAAALIRERRSAGLPIPLRIRFASCEAKAVLEHYPAFQRMLDDNGIDLDLAPRDWRAKLLHGKNLTRLDPDWLRESL